MNKNKETEQKSVRPSTKDNLASFMGALLALSVIGIAVAITLGYIYKWEGVGVVNSKTGEIKSLWDWMELLLIPFVLAIGAFLLNKSERAHEQKLANQQHENERDIAEQRAANERETAKDAQRQMALETYFDRMTELLLDKGLRTSHESDEVRSIARTRTLAVLRELDGKRRGQVLQFLYELNTISGSAPVIDMSFADLREIELPYAKLENITLPKVNLRRANLYMTKLKGANFDGADLDEANLSWADLSNANLQCGLKKSNLGVAQLVGAKLFRANLSGACLINASLIGADMRYANLKYVHETLRDLEETNIELANLALADMSGCDLSGATLDELQLLTVKSLKGATMPNKMGFEEWRETNKSSQNGS